MTMALQIALFLASIAVVIFVALCIPAVFLLRRQAERMAAALAELKAEVSALVQESRTTLHNLDELTARTHQQFDDLEHVIQAVRGWTGRVEHVVDEVGDAIEPPVLAAARSAQVVYKGITKFFQTFKKRNQPQPKKVEEQHVRE